MDERRKVLGRRIYRARKRLGYGSQKQFAEAIGKSEASVANAERGKETVGKDVFAAIEDGLRWPEDCIARYLETGDESHLPTTTTSQPEKPPLTSDQRQLVDIYYALRASYGKKEARRRLAELIRRLNEDETAVNTAIEQEPEPVE